VRTQRHIFQFIDDIHSSLRKLELWVYSLTFFLVLVKYMSWLNYHHLFYFHTIAYEGSIAKASRRLRLGQPTLSTQLKQLETSLGHQLFERSNRSLKLTDTGRVVYEYATEIFRMGREMVQAVGDHLTSRRVQLHLGVQDGVPKSFAYQLALSSFRTGDCFVSIGQGTPDFLLHELQAGRIDIVLSNGPIALGSAPRFVSRRIGKIPVGAFATENFSGLRENFPQSLDKQPVLLPMAPTKVRADIDHFFGAHSIVPNVVGEAQDFELLKLLSMSGQGVALVPLLPELGSAREGLVPLGTLEGVADSLWLTSIAARIQNPIGSELISGFQIQ